MTTLITLYLLFGLLSYWPLMLRCEPPRLKCEWYHWLCAWAVWCFVWPYGYALDLIYWLGAKK